MRWLARLRSAFVREPAHIPEPLWQQTLASLPFLSRLDRHELGRLKSLCEALLDRKPVSGARGFEISDEIAVLVAAQACVLVLNLELALYDDLSAILIVPDAFGVRQQHVDEAGVVHEWEEELAGEAIDQGGAVVLSWVDVASQHDAGATHNIVIHEFAHKIDMGRGAANGFPPLLKGLHDPAVFSCWPDVFNAAYQDFCERVDVIEAQLPDDFDPDQYAHADYYDELAATLPLDPYAASDPAEFFAVASEAFFVDPASLATGYPEVYRLLSAYYRQQPLKGIEAEQERPGKPL